MVQLDNFEIVKLDDTDGALTAAKKLWADSDFVPDDKNYWLATFTVGKLRYQAGIRLGHRRDVAANMLQCDTQLRVPEEKFGEDGFIPEAEVAEITKAVSDRFTVGEYWKK
jgi:hypothetical protein